jgi:cation transport regulator ChaC
MKKYIFGYGSLVNNESRFLTLKRHTEPIKVVLDSSSGYVRKWNYYNKEKNIIALGLEKQITGNYVNGILFDVYDDEITLLDKREIGYEKITILPSYINILSKNKLQNMDNSIIYTYIPTMDYKLYNNIDYISPNKVNQVYLNKCCVGFSSHNYDFYELFVNNTCDWKVLLKYV